MEKLETALGDSGITAVEFMQTLENLLDARVKEDTSLDVVDAPVAKAPLKKKQIKRKQEKKQLEKDFNKNSLMIHGQKELKKV